MPPAPTGDGVVSVAPIRACSPMACGLWPLLDGEHSAGALSAGSRWQKRARSGKVPRRRADCSTGRSDGREKNVFRGTFPHAIDAKGRTSLPARFRDVLAGRSEDQLVLTQGPDRSLWCLPPSAWMELENKVRAMSQFNPKVRNFMLSFIAPAQDCAIDKMGRVLVPPTLREYAGLQGEVMWAGMIDRVELWSLERWKQRHEEAQSSLDEGAFSEMGDLGL